MRHASITGRETANSKSTSSSSSSSSSNPLGAYFREIREGSLLSSDEERTLADAIRNGDEDARNRLVQCNLRLVVKVARDFVGRGLALEDLVGEGNLGLIRAAECYDSRFGTRFSTYASYWIKQAIRHALINTTATIRLPAHMIGLLTKWRRAEREFLRTHGQPPTFDQVAKALDLSANRRSLMERALLTCRLTPGGAAAEGDSERLDDAADPCHSPEASLEADDERQDLLNRMERLDPRERMIVDLRFGLGGADPLTLKEVGHRLGVTREWVRKIEARAVRKLDDEPTDQTNSKPTSPSLRPRRSHANRGRTRVLQMA